MKSTELKVRIALVDKKAFCELVAELKVDAIMKMCPTQFKIQVLENALKKLIDNKWIMLLLLEN